MRTRPVLAALAAGLFSLLSGFCGAVEPQFAAGTSGNVAAIKSDGTLWTWGDYRTAGQAEPSQIARPFPILVGTEATWRQVAAIGTPFFAIKADGTLWGWGDSNLFGDGTAGLRATPVQIGADHNWVQVAASSSHVVGIRSDGTLWAWGSNAQGQLGIFTFPTPPIFLAAPTQVVDAGNNWSKVSAGNGMTLAIRGDGTLWSFGAPLFFGGVVVGPNPYVIQVSTDTDWADVVVGINGARMLKADGSLWRIGLGDGPVDPIAFSPQPVAVGSTWRSIAGCQGVTLGIRSDKTLWGAGFALRGLALSFDAPSQIGADANWLRVSCNSTNTTASLLALALKDDGTLAAWGPGAATAIGDGRTLLPLSPKTLDAATNWKSYFPHLSNLLLGGAGVKTDGTLWQRVPSGPSVQILVGGLPADTPWKQASGINFLPEFLALTAHGTLYRLFSPPPGLPTFGFAIGADGEWDSISGGGSHILAVKKDGTLWAWGDNSFGQLGNGLVGPFVPDPVQVGTDSDWRAASAGGRHSVAIKADGTVWAWGSNANGQLGNGTNLDSPLPVQLSVLTGVAKVAAGEAHTLALKNSPIVANLSLWAWGRNDRGQLGDGTTIDRNVPTSIDPGPFNDIAASSSSYALRIDARLFAWGPNAGQLGDGSLRDRVKPTQIGHDRWSFVSGGGIAVNNDGTLWGWGSNVNFLPGVAGITVPTATTWNALAPSASLTGAELVDDYVIDFNEAPLVAPGIAPTTQVLTLRAGAADISVSGISIEEPVLPHLPVPPQFTPVHDCPATLAANTSCTITVLFKPTAPGSASGLLRIASNATVSNAPSPLAGIGTLDTIPDPFTFGSLVDVPMSTLQVSAPVTPIGYNWFTAISVTGGEFCINSPIPGPACACDSTPFQSTPGTISAGQSICARHVSSANPASSVSTTVTVGGIGGVFTTTTARAPTTTSIASSQNPAMLNAPVTFTATVNGSFGAPDGNVMFKDGGAAVDTAALASGQATFATSALAVGAHVMTAEYAGGASYLPSVSAPLVQGITTGNSPALGTVLDFNHDGKEDILVPSAGSATLYLMAGSTVIGTVTLAGPGPGWTLAFVADFNADGKSDLVWQGNPGEIELWLMDGLTPIVKQRLAGLPAGAVPTSIGDFDGDGKSDLLLTAANGEVDLWLMDGIAQKASATLAAATAGLTVAQVGDLDGDGKTDIIWQASDGSIVMWLMNGLVASATSTLVPPTAVAAAFTAQPMAAAMLKAKAPTWTVRALGDFNGDGRRDLVLTDSNDRTVMLLMKGLQVLASAEVAPTKTKIDAVHAVDLDGDGMDDLVIEFKDGTVEGRLMNGVAVKARAVLPQDGKKFNIMRTGDLNGDRKGDILWQDKNADKGNGKKSAVTVWIMNGLNVQSSQVIGK